MARILIVGGAGYVGSHTAKTLAASHELVVLDNLSRGHSEFVKWGPLVVADIRDRAALGKIFHDYQFDSVMHFAALAYVGESVESPSTYYDVNVNGTRNLLDAMICAGVKRIVFSSTCAVYGEHNGELISEETQTAPINPYGVTKLVCEKMMDDFEKAYGLLSVRLRYFNAAGDDPELEIGEDHSPETHLIPIVLDAALGRRAFVPILGNDYETSDSTAVRDYVHVLDLADAHARAMNFLLAGRRTAVLNLGTGRGVSVAELIRAAKEVTGMRIDTEIRARRGGDPARLVADPSRAERVLGWKAQRSDIGTILTDAWRWHRHRFGVSGGS